MQDRLEGDMRIVRHGVSQRQGPMGGQLGHQTIRKRTDRLVLLGGLRVGAGRRTADGDDGPLHGALRAGDRHLAAAFGLATRDRFNRRLVLGPDEAALDAQRALAVDADEDAGTGDLGRIVADGPVFECRHGGLDLAEALIDLVRQFVGLGILRLKGVLFGLERGKAGVFLVGEFDSLAGQAAQAGGVAVGEVASDRDPFPPLGAQRFGLGLKLLDHQPIEQSRVLQPTAIVMLEEVAHDHAAGGLIGCRRRRIARAGPPPGQRLR